MKDSSVKFDHQFCERLNQEYRKLHNNNYAMLGDLKYFFLKLQYEIEHSVNP